MKGSGPYKTYGSEFLEITTDLIQIRNMALALTGYKLYIFVLWLDLVLVRISWIRNDDI
jgi:hypothetical protein